MNNEDKRGPGLKFPPPFMVAGVIGVAMLVDSLQPLPITDGETRWWSGAVITLLAFVLAVLALVQFLAARTHVEPWQPTTTVIQHGVFRFSRNPIYLAFCIATPGIGLMLNSWWIVASLPFVILLLRQLVIRREEAYLERKFGDHYLGYKRRVRRWF